jgi:uroporphyrinogen decarboxylase
MDHLFLRACRREPVERVPVWFMRQAGRYMPEYRAVRAGASFWQMCRTPELACQVTLQPIERFGFDAAILFSDILVVLPPMGLDVEFGEGGPHLAAPVARAADVGKLRVPDPEEAVPFVMEAVRQIRRGLADRVPLIGFAGAPFTLASYLLEGRSPRRFRWTKALMLEGSPWWDDLMRRLTDTTIAYLQAQVEAGAQALQLFDSWAGALSPPHYARFVLPHTRRIFQALRSAGIPLIHFGTETATLLELMAEAGPDVVGADWRMPLDEAWRRMGHERAIQGNLDPAVLFAPWQSVQKEARDVLDRAAGRSGHIFNLGHGILPETPVENVRRLVDFVHDASRRILT